MKTPVAITLIAVGALLILTPVIMNFIDRQQATQEGNMISIKNTRPWGSTASMAIGVGLVGATALLACLKNNGPESIYVPKDHDLGQHDSSIRGELQRPPAQASPILIRNFVSTKPGSGQTSNLKEQA